MINMLLARRRILLAKQSGGGEALPTDMGLLINSPNTGNFSVTTNYGTFTAVKVSDYPYLGTTVTHKLSISGVTFSTGQKISGTSAVRGLFVGVESWGTANTYTNTSSLFYECTNLRGIPDSWTGLVNLTIARDMFAGCTSLTSIPESWEGLGSLWDAFGMFQNCKSIEGIPASWEGLDSLTNARSMFQNCKSIEGIPASWEGLGAVTAASYMFRGCTSLESIPASWTGLGAVTDASGMFWGCTSLASIPESCEGLVNLTNASLMFADCIAMQGDIYALYVYLSTKPIAVSNYLCCFHNCTQAIGYSSIPASWR